MITTDEKRQRQLARQEAQRRLNQRHAAELRELMVAAHQARGLEYQPRLTPEERLVEQARELLKEPAVKQALADGVIG